MILLLKKKNIPYGSVLKDDKFFKLYDEVPDHEKEE
jgi:hypothetical protein